MDRYAVIARIVIELFAPDVRLALVVPDGRRFGDCHAATTVVIHDDTALHHLIRAPGELGFARAYVSGALDVRGDLWAPLEHLATGSGGLQLSLRQVTDLARVLGVEALSHRPAIPPEEIDVGGRWRAHSRSRDRTAVSHHYDVGNDFYRLLLGESMTYSCAVFESADDPLTQAQYNKVELICRKLGLRPGQRLLDVGCGWGTLVLHAARHYGVSAVGITVSHEQAELARERVAAEGLAGQVEIRIEDYRDVSDGPFDAISSVGMFEHVGDAQRAAYLGHLHRLLRPGGRLLNHQIGRPATRHSRLGRTANHVDRDGFIHRFIFPDGALHEVGTLVSAIQAEGLEVRHLESLREHYELTLRRWISNLESNWEAAVAASSEGRARAWRLYLTGSAVGFKVGTLQIHQIVAVNAAHGRSSMPWRSVYERRSLSEHGNAAATIDLRQGTLIGGDRKSVV